MHNMVCGPNDKETVGVGKHHESARSGLERHGVCEKIDVAPRARHTMRNGIN